MQQQGLQQSFFPENIFLLRIRKYILILHPLKKRDSFPDSPPGRTSDPPRRKGHWFKRIMNIFYVYVIKNALSKQYIGHTNNLDRRLQEHNLGLSPYTKGKGPWTLFYQESLKPVQKP